MYVTRRIEYCLFLLLLSLLFVLLHSPPRQHDDIFAIMLYVLVGVILGIKFILLFQIIRRDAAQYTFFFVQLSEKDKKEHLSLSLSFSLAAGTSFE